MKRFTLLLLCLIASTAPAPAADEAPKVRIVEVPGAKLAVVRLADGNLLGLRQSAPDAW